MATLLFLPHRIPYPPDKGDKVRSWNLLKHLAQRHRVHVGTFVDDPDDLRHLDAMRALCASLHISRLHPRRARVASLAGLASGAPLTLHYYRDDALQRWVDETLVREPVDAALIFSSSMAQYLDTHAGVPMLVDFVDVDSAKWTAYAQHHHWPMSALYRREGRTLLAEEQRIAARARSSFFATEKEAALFRGMAPESASRCHALGNGVDATFFAPDASRPSPFGAAEVPLVFTGAMDYWPNIDAVTWFAGEALPRLRAVRPQLRFYIVGRNPTAQVRALAADDVVVTGTVPDVRPYLEHAAVVVAPLRLARGVQNKILEAMAMQRVVVAAAECAGALQVRVGEEIAVATRPQEYVDAVLCLLDAPEVAAAMGKAARHRVVESYSWRAHLSALDAHLAAFDQGALPRACAVGQRLAVVPSEAAAP